MKKIIDKIITAASVGVIVYTATSVALNKAKADRRKAEEMKNKVDKMSAEIKAEYGQYSAEIETAQNDFKVTNRALSPEESASVLEEFGVFDAPKPSTISVVFSDPDEEQVERLKEKCFQHFTNDDVIRNLQELVAESNGGVCKAARYHGDCMTFVGKLNGVKDTWQPATFNMTQNIETLLEVTNFKSLLDSETGDELIVNRDFFKAYLSEAMQAIARAV